MTHEHTLPDGTPYSGPVGRHITNIPCHPSKRQALSIAREQIPGHLSCAAREEAALKMANEILLSIIGPPEGNALVSSAELAERGYYGVYRR